MPNRQWKPPVDEVYGGDRDRPTASWASTSSPTARGTAYRARTRPPSFIHFAVVPAPDRGAPDQRRGGGAGELEHHRGGVGSVSGRTDDGRVLGRERASAEDLRTIQAYLPRYPSKQAVTLPALHLVHDELRCVPHEAIGEIADMLDLHPAEVHDTMTFYDFFRDEDDTLGKTRLWVCRSLACCSAAATSCSTTARPSSASSPATRRPTARSRWSSPSASAPATGPRPCLVNDEHVHGRDAGEGGRVDRGAAGPVSTHGRRSNPSSLAARSNKPNIAHSARTATAPTAATPRSSKALKRLKPAQVVDAGQGLRPARPRRGRASRPASSGPSCPKDHPGPIYLCVNADESEPCTFNNRILMEKDPHQVLEGIMLAVLRHHGPRRPTSTSATSTAARYRALQTAIDELLRRRPARQEHPRHAASTSTSTCTAGPGRTSAARRPG